MEVNDIELGQTEIYVMFTSQRLFEGVMPPLHHVVRSREVPHHIPKFVPHDVWKKRWPPPSAPSGTIPNEVFLEVGHKLSHFIIVRHSSGQHFERPLYIVNRDKRENK